MVEVPAMPTDEKAILRRSLERHRDAFLWKLEGLDDEQLRRKLVPSGTSLLGLLHHLASVEYGWFCWSFGRPAEGDGDWGKYADADEGVDDEDDEESPLGSLADERAYFDRARTAALAAFDETPLDQTVRAWWGDGVTARWVAVHMIEEIARHAGHADIIRELIDGETGDHKRD